MSQLREDGSCIRSLLTNQDHQREEASRGFSLVQYHRISDVALSLFLNEVVYLNVWYNLNFAVIVPAILYLSCPVALTVGRARRQDA